jgi:serine/threonine protein kinase
MKADALIGAVLGSCTLQRLLEQGSMGAVFLAQQSRPHRHVAVKVLVPPVTLTPQQQATFLERFRREADAAASLDHPHILPVYEYGERDGLAYLVMPYISGGTLRDEMKREGAFPFPKVVQYLDQVAAALDAAHARGVIHRGVKPTNILLAPVCRLFLTDFGLVGIVEQTSGLSASPGTSDYIAPEQVSGEQVDARADLYALGVTLYQMVTGKLPFQGETPIQVALHHLHTPPHPPHLLRADLPLAAGQVMLRALAKRPADRYMRAQDFANAFKLTLTAADIELISGQDGETGSYQLSATRIYTPHGLFDPTWQVDAKETIDNPPAALPFTVPQNNAVVMAPAQDRGASTPLSVSQNAKMLPPPSTQGSRLLRHKVDLVRTTNVDETLAAPPNRVPLNPLTPAPGEALSAAPASQPTAGRPGLNPPSPVPFSNTTMSLRVPKTEQGTTGALKLTGPARVVHVPIVGQPGRYVTGLLPAPAVKPIALPLPVRSKSRLRMAVLIAIVLMVVLGTSTFSLLHGRSAPTNQPSKATVVKATPNLTATGGAYATATAHANIILFDPLTQNIHNWPTASKGPQLYTFENNGYHITDNDDNQGAPALLSDIPAVILSKPFAYSITMEEIKGDDATENNAFGMIFRFSVQKKNDKHMTTFYTFEVTNTTNGEYQFWKYDDSVIPTTSSPWSLLWHQSYGKEYHFGRGPKGVNIFKVFMNGQKFTVWVNGNQVANLKDGSLTGGQVGMLVNWKGTEVAFTNLELTYN